MSSLPLPDIEPVFTTRDVAKVFGVTEPTIRRWADQGHLTGFKHPGGHWRFRWPDVEQLMEALGRDE